MQLSCCSCGPSTVLSQFHSKEGIRNPVVFTATLSTVSKCPRQHTPWKNDVGEFLYQGWQLTSTPSMWQNRFDNECKQHGRETREHIWSTKTLNYLERVVIAPQTPSIKKKQQKKHFFYYHNLQCATRPWQHHHKSKEIQL